MGNYTIHKRVLEITDRQRITIPFYARIISFGVQADQPVMWYITDPSDIEDQEIEIAIFGTGHPLPDDMTNWSFLGTLLTHEGRLVWHLFRPPHNLPMNVDPDPFRS